MKGETKEGLNRIVHNQKHKFSEGTLNAFSFAKEFSLLQKKATAMFN